MSVVNEILILIGLTLAPFLELRASIPYGIIHNQLHWLLVFAICVITNIILAPIVYIFIDRFVHLLFFIKPFEKFYHKTVEKSQKKIHKAVERWGWLGVALFIGIPLPGSGVYSGALGSYVLGLGFRKFMAAAVIGVLIAGIIVTAVMLTGSQIFSIFLRT